MEFNVQRAERTLSLLTSTYLANTDAVAANLGLVIETFQSQNLLGFTGAHTAPAEVVKRYEGTVHKWLTRINSLATGKTSESRLAGVLLMKYTAEQSPKIFVENASKWMASLLAILGKSEVDPVYEATMETLVGFLDVVREVPELQRDVAAAQVPRVNQTVLALAEKNSELVNWFPTLFRPSIDKTVKLCLKYLTGETAGGKMTVEERWFEYMQLTMGTIDWCIDHIMCVDAGAPESERREFGDLPKLSSDFMASIPQAVDRITGMVELFTALLTRPTSANIAVPIELIVETISRLAFVPLRIANAKTDRAEYSLVPLLAPRIHMAAVHMLAALAVALGDYLQPFLGGIARTVAVINSKLMGSAATQTAVFALIQLYVERFGFGFEFVAHIVSSTNVRGQQQRAAPAPAASKASRKRGSKQVVEEESGSAESLEYALVQLNSVNHSALCVVTAILVNAPTAFTTVQRTQIDGQLLTLLLLQTVNHDRTVFAGRQTDVEYTAQLFECLLASVLSPDPWQKAIVPHRPKIQCVCTRALAAIEPVVHAKLPAQMRGPAPEEEVEMDKSMLDELVQPPQQNTVAEDANAPIQAKRVKLDEPLIEKTREEKEPATAADLPAKKSSQSEPAAKKPVESALPKLPAVPTFKPAASGTPANTSASTKEEESDGEEFPDIVMEGSDSEDED
ncbi:hypothetical protein DL89DRAFT_263707 [Linderina pennispora]|uniref:Pre-rRNA-processing protein RIX1 n=1 Tax=Linderina pennispora TaxID=61395 RepID=A0A1Y1WKG1_9FUNG|nr:uncharacterized protein DL89DRAFT_263707 [Linderina pennispora]ORX73686.1 hypothetical protein DL89DRAFT_263707 [Linderina pennispora]